MKDSTPIAVASRSFSKHPVLRAELEAQYDNIHFNDKGESLNGDSFIQFASGCRKIITALERIDDSILENLPDLEVISKYGVGMDMIDIPALTRRGIRLGWTGGVNRRSVSELAISFMISLLHLVPLTNQEVRAGQWINRKGRQLSGRTVGIIGCGHIGKDLVPILQSFDCKILVNDILDFPEFYRKHQIEAVALQELLRRSDVVTLHVPLDDSTRLILNAERLALLQPGAVLINTARGGLVDEAALKEMLAAGRLAAAGFDVFSPEPPEDPELLRLPNFLATPHIGGSSEEAILAMGRAAIRGLKENRVPDAGFPANG